MGKPDAVRLQYENTDLKAPEDEAAAGKHCEEVKLQTQNTAREGEGGSGRCTFEISLESFHGSAVRVWLRYVLCGSTREGGGYVGKR